MASFIVDAIAPLLALVSASNSILLVTGFRRTKSFLPSDLLRSSLIELTQVPYEGFIDALIELLIFSVPRGYRGQNTLI